MFDRPRSCWRFSNLASAEKSDFALKWGTFSSSRCVAGNSPSASLSQTYHRRLRLSQVEQERTAALFFYPTGTFASELLRCGGNKRASRRLERKRNATATLGPLFFQAETAGIADSLKLGCNCLFYLERKAK